VNGHTAAPPGMMLHMELVEFLRARLDEREATAVTVKASLYDTAAHLTFDMHDRTDPDAVVIRKVRVYDPARVLAEVEAQRRIVDEIAPEVERHDDQITAEWGGSNDGTAEKLLCLLALPYADHPDYRPEWKP
jgi:hypothetical protein